MRQIKFQQRADRKGYDVIADGQNLGRVWGAKVGMGSHWFAEDTAGNRVAGYRHTRKIAAGYLLQENNCP